RHVHLPGLKSRARRVLGPFEPLGRMGESAQPKSGALPIARTQTILNCIFSDPPTRHLKFGAISQTDRAYKTALTAGRKLRASALMRALTKSSQSVPKRNIKAIRTVTFSKWSCCELFNAYDGTPGLRVKISDGKNRDSGQWQTECRREFFGSAGFTAGAKCSPSRSVTAAGSARKAKPQPGPER